MKRDKYDDAFSIAVRETANWTCERCGIHDPEGAAKGKSWITHCSHIYGRRNLATRWHPDNGVCLCAACHKELGDDPIEHAAFARKRLGDVRFDALKLLANSVYKWPKSEKEEMYKHYRSEIKRIKSQRQAGSFPDPLVSYQ